MTMSGEYDEAVPSVVSAVCIADKFCSQFVNATCKVDRYAKWGEGLEDAIAIAVLAVLKEFVKEVLKQLMKENPEITRLHKVKISKVIIYRTGQRPTPFASFERWCPPPRGTTRSRGTLVVVDVDVDRHGRVRGRELQVHAQIRVR